MFHTATRAVPTAIVCLIVLAVATAPSLQAQKPELNPAPNYDLAAQWTSQKVGKLVFDTSVTPRWLEKSDRFWYAFQTREGRRFSFVDPLKKSKAPLFDHAKMAASLTSITRIPYDAQHLPFNTVRFVKNDTAFEFDVRVPADASIVTPPKRVTTTAAQGQEPEPDSDAEPRQQRAAGATRTPARAAESHAAFRI